MKKIILLLIIAIISLQLVAAPNNVPSDSVTAKLNFGNINLPSGVVTGYNLTMQDDALLSVFGVQSKAVYFVVGDEPAFYRKTTEDNIQLFEVSADNGLIATAVSADSSDIVVNGLPYIFAFGDRIQFNLNVNFDGSLYSILFGRVNSDNAIRVGDNSGQGLFLYNDNSGSLVLLKDDNSLINDNLAAPKTVTFRAPIGAAGGENNEEAEARRLERAGAQADVTNIEGCTDVDAGQGQSTTSSTQSDGEQYSTASYGYDETGTFLSDFCAADRRGAVVKKTLNEVKCNADGSLFLEEHECTGVCQNGACTASAGGEVAFCYDSDTNGEATNLNSNKIVSMAETKGVVAGFYAAGRDISYGLWDDSCLSDTELVEYSCKSHKVRFFTINCLSGCSEGKCASPPYCFDTDGGNNVNAQGKVIFSGDSIAQYNQEEQDVCHNETTVKEKVCRVQPTGSLLYPYDAVLVNCPNGCQAGKCLKSNEVSNVGKTPCSAKSDCKFSQACIKTGTASASLHVSNQNVAAQASAYTFNELESKSLFGKTVKLETIGANSVIVTVDGESKTINLNGVETINNLFVSLSSIQPKVGGFCDKCTRSSECGSGFVCSANRCKPASGRCQTDTNCKIGKYCNPRVGQLGFCENEPLNSLDDITAALERRWKRVNVYARVIAGSEVLHNLALPPKVRGGQTCLVNNQCISNECNPDTGTCVNVPAGNPDLPDPNTPNAGNIANAADAANMGNLGAGSNNFGF